MTLLLAIGIAYAQPHVAGAQETSPAAAGDPPPVPPSGEPKGLLDLNLDQLSKQDVVIASLDTVVNSVSREVSTVGRSVVGLFPSPGRPVRLPASFSRSSQDRIVTFES